MKRIITLAVAIAVAFPCFLTSRECDAAVIDDFSDFDTAPVIASNGTHLAAIGGYDVTANEVNQTFSYTETPMLGVAGGDRTVETTNYSGTGSYVVGLRDGSLIVPHLSLSNGNNQMIDLALIYDGASLVSDINGNPIFTVSFRDLDLGDATSLNVTATADDGTPVSLTQSLGLAEDVLNVFDVPFDFSATTTDLNLLQNITFDFVANGGAADFTLSGINAVATPEPASLAIWTLLGLITCVAASRLKRRNS